MGLLGVLTPREPKKSGVTSPTPWPLPLAALETSAQSPSDACDSPRGTSKLGKLVSLLTPRGRRDGESPSDSPFASPRVAAAGSQKDQAHKTSLAGLTEQQMRLSAPLTTPRALHPLETADSDSDGDSEAGSDASSLDGFGKYARRLEDSQREESLPADSPAVPTPASAEPADKLMSPRQPQGRVQLSSPRLSASISQEAADDLQRLLQFGELPASRLRIARLLAHADAQGGKPLASLSLHHLGYSRCTALLLQLLLPLSLHGRSGALAQLQRLASGQLMSYLGPALERVLESQKGCERFCRLPFEVASWLLEHAACDRGETVFDLGHLWLEQQRQRQPSWGQRTALADLVWRRPVAADFLRCMAANLEWAADCVAASSLRPPRVPATLDGRFAFTAEFELHDLLDLQAAAQAEGRPQQKQSPTLYCGGYCWWATLAAQPRHDRFHLLACCAPFSLFQEPYRSSLQPAADVHFAFLGKTCLADWRQTDAQRREAMHTHWGGAAFRAPSNAAVLQDKGGDGSPPSAPSIPASPARVRFQLAADARPDTARSLRPAARQPSRLSVSSSGSLPGGATPRPGGGLGGGASSLGRTGSGTLSIATPRTPGYRSAESSGALTARPAEADAAPLQQLSMDQLVEEVRRSCPYVGGASLRVRVHVRLLGGATAPLVAPAAAP